MVGGYIVVWGANDRFADKDSSDKQRYAGIYLEY